MQKLRPIFILHSGKDRELIAGVIESFDLYNRTVTKKRPYIVITKDKLNGSKEPHWLQVKEEIEKSEALILIKSAIHSGVPLWQACFAAQTRAATRLQTYPPSRSSSSDR